MRSEAPNPRQEYVEKLYAREDEGLRAVRERLTAAGRWGVNIGASEGVTLQILLRAIGARRVVEVGTLYGYSAVWIARALGANGHLYTIERDAQCAAIARMAFAECKIENSVTLLEGEASAKLLEIEKQAPFDAIFIDANKSAYVEYLDWATQHVRSGGLIIADNTFLGGAVLALEKPAACSQKQWSEMRRFNELIADRSKYHATILPTGEGLTVAIKL